MSIGAWVWVAVVAALFVIGLRLAFLDIATAVRPYQRPAAAAKARTHALAATVMVLVFGIAIGVIIARVWVVVTADRYLPSYNPHLRADKESL